jgi:hypothetical protein
MSKIELFRKIYDNHCKTEKWIDSIPSDIRTAFYDNTYIETLQQQSDMLIKQIFSEEEIGDMEWFLYEWANGGDRIWRINGQEFGFENIDDYIEMLVEHRGWVL